MTTPQLTLETLPDAYREARVAASLLAKHSTADVPPRTCRYCGKYRQTWAGARIDGHAACIVSVAFQDATRELYRSDPGLTIARIGEVVGVSSSVVNCWLRLADRRDLGRRVERAA